MNKNNLLKVNKCLMAFVLILFSLATVKAQNKTEVIAHRGYWQTEGSSQNSLTSFRKAAEVGVYGSEFDVHLTADNVLVVYHDNKIDGREIQKCNYKDLTKIRLFNGEKLPTLEKYLKKAKKQDNIELIFELKSHESAKRDDEAAKLSVEMVEKMGLADRTTYIAFSKYAAESLRKYAPNAEVYYLNGDLNPEQLKEMKMSGFDYHYKVVQKNPEWIKEAHNLGMKVNVWTVNDSDTMKEMVNLGVDYITTDHPETAVKVINSYSK